MLLVIAKILLIIRLLKGNPIKDTMRSLSLYVQTYFLKHAKVGLSPPNNLFLPSFFD